MKDLRRVPGHHNTSNLALVLFYVTDFRELFHLDRLKFKIHNDRQCFPFIYIYRFYLNFKRPVFDADIRDQATRFAETCTDITFPVGVQLSMAKIVDMTPWLIRFIS